MDFLRGLLGRGADKTVEARPGAEEPPAVPRPAPEEAVLAGAPVPQDCRIGPWRVADLVGQGGMASVFRVEDEAGAAHAMKIPHVELVEEDEFRTRFHREIAIATRLSHPHIVRIAATGSFATRRHGEVPYVVMELVEGRSLDRVIEEGQVPADEAVRVSRGVAEALAEAHRNGVVHRDVKPGNILLGVDGGVKLTDFGMARSDDSRTLTATGTLLGTPAYLAPEQVMASREAGPPADVYSLGVVLFELLSGRLPFSNPNPMAILTSHMSEAPPSLREVASGVTPAMADLVDSMLAKDPDERPSAGDVASRLAEIASRET